MNADQSPDHPDIIAFPPLIWLVCALISWFVHWYSPAPMMKREIAIVLGIASLIAGPTLALSAVVAMKKAGTNIDPAKTGAANRAWRPFSFHAQSDVSFALLSPGRPGLFLERLANAHFRAAAFPGAALRGDFARRRIPPSKVRRGIPRAETRRASLAVGKLSNQWPAAIECRNSASCWLNFAATNCEGERALSRKAASLAVAA
jgi:hypothetical protein